MWAELGPPKALRSQREAVGSLILMGGCELDVGVVRKKKLLMVEHVIGFEVDAVELWSPQNWCCSARQAEECHPLEMQILDPWTV